MASLCEELPWRCDLETWLSDYWLQLLRKRKEKRRRRRRPHIHSLSAHVTRRAAHSALSVQGRDVRHFLFAAWSLRLGSVHVKCIDEHARNQSERLERAETLLLQKIIIITIQNKAVRKLFPPVSLILEPSVTYPASCHVGQCTSQQSLMI